MTMPHAGGEDPALVPPSVSSSEWTPSSAPIVQNATNSSSAAAAALVPPSLLSHEDRISIVRKHFSAKGYRVHSGLQFGCELVLYSDSPALVHSDFCVHVPADACGTLDWRTLQTLVRMMPDLRKTLIVAHVVAVVAVEEAVTALEEKENGNSSCYKTGIGDHGESRNYSYKVHELAFATEHAPFRHKHTPQGVGTQVKPQPSSQSSQIESG